MKKIISIVLFICAIIMSVTPVTAFASNDTQDNVVFSVEEFEALEHTYAVYSQTRATGLITGHRLGIAKSGNTLYISGYTYGNDEVIKCGFTEIIIERRVNSSSSWSEYYIYDDLYLDSNKYTLSKTISVPSGYQYRVTATHYAKKSLFSVQKIDAETGYLTF